MSNAIDLTSNPPDTSTLGGSSPIGNFGGQPTSGVGTTQVSSTTTTAGIFYGQDFTGINLFVYDLQTGSTSLISATPAGQLSNSTSTIAFLSPDGQTLYFDSNAADLTADANPAQFVQIFTASAPFSVANQVQFQSWETAATEASGQVVVTVLRSGPATAPASVDYTVQSGTAQTGIDFMASSGTLNFAAGQTSQTFTVKLNKGDEFNGTRSAELVLSNPQGASLGYPSAVLDLTANPPPSISPVTTPTPTPTSTGTTKPGAVVSSATLAKGRRGATELVIKFSGALDPAAATNVASYGVTLPGRTKHGEANTGLPSWRDAPCISSPRFTTPRTIRSP